MSNQKPSEAICPVCGYYCLGKGGFGCIDKPSLVNKEASPEAKLAAARAVIEEAEHVLEDMKTKMQDQGMFESKYKIADKALTRIREWKETGK